MKALALILTFLTSLSYASERSAFTLQATRPIKHVKIEVNQERTLVLRGVVVDSNINALKNQFDGFVAASNDPIYLIIDSPGGSVDAGMRFVNTIRSARAALGIKTFCIIENKAYSMAAIISSFCYRTYMLTTASLLYHEVSYGIQGPATQNLSRALYLTNEANVLNHVIAQALHMNDQLYYDLMVRELWLTSYQAVTQGVADGIMESVYYTAKPPEVNMLELLFGNESSELWGEYPTRKFENVIKR